MYSTAGCGCKTEQTSLSKCK